jgi:adenylosuccinate lyase
MSILANRYASDEMKDIWSPRSKIIAERKLWITVMKTQSELGFDIPAPAISSYEKVLEKVDLESIDKRERELRHDVKARIDEFNSLAGYQYIHIGMTSRDLTENIEAYQILSALKLTNFKALALLSSLAKKIEEYKALPIVGRSHNVPAQITTLGKRFATVAEELLFAQTRLENLIELFPLRGLKGPVGTSQDSLDLMGDNFEKLESAIAKSLGFETVLDSTGQIYPRSIDYQVVSSLLALAAAPSNMAISIRLMAGNDLVSEGFKKGQVGSSAMPHKMNTRSCERINGLAVILKGYATMLSEISGGQWSEGDVSDSVVRRVALADAFYCIDGLLETSLTVLDEFGIYPAMIEKEIKTHLPLLASTKILLAAVKKGMGREDAHEIIKSASLALASAMRQAQDVDFIDLLTSDGKLPLSRSEIEALISDPLSFAGNAVLQCQAVLSKISPLLARQPEAASYKARPIR